MRGVRGVEAAALVREAGPAGSYRVSLRSADPEVDVSAIAREEGGGGHRAAAGFSTRRAPEELLRWLEARMAERLDAN
jgi:phosphoesterase RecJ-like protein